MAENIPAQIGRYEVVRRLGRGGMGVVYLARDPFIEREVAIKLLRAIDDDDAQERFQREIRIAGALSHPNIVRIYDAGSHDGQPFVAMEYVNGQTLSEVIKAGTPLELDRKIEMLLDLADGLGYAHKRGVIHRDIKPSNLIIDDHGTLKILDFGIARLSDSGRTSLSAVGTPSYMAPEQILGEVVDARADLFSFGVVVYELIAYRQPFTGDSEHSVYHKILHSQPDPLSKIAPGTPATLDTFMGVALAKKADERFQTAKALADDLRTVRSALTADETVVVARPKTRPSAPSSSSSQDVPAVPPLPPGAGPSTMPVATQSGAGTRSPASRRLADLRERQIAAAKEEARKALAEGRPNDALEAAERAMVLDENDQAAQELAELARRAMERAEARRAIAQAEQLLTDGNLTGARRVVEEARAQAPQDTDLAALDLRIGQMIRDRESAAQREHQVKEALAEARRRLDAGELETAHAAVTRALTLEAGNAEAERIKATIETALRKRRVETEWQDAARQATARARDLAGRGALGEAIQLLERFVPPHPDTQSLLNDLRARQAALAADQKRRAEEEQRRAARARGIDQATALIVGNDADGALRVLADLRAAGFVDDEIFTIEQRANDLRLALAQERRRAAMLARGLESIRAALAKRDADAALFAVEQLREDGFDSPELGTLEHQAFTLQQQIDQQRQQQIDRDRRSARLADGVTEVQLALQRRDADAALAALGLLKREGFDAPELARLEQAAQALRQQLGQERQQQIERDRRAARLAKGLEEIRGALSQRDPDAALAAITLLRRDGLDAPELAQVEREAQALQKQLAQARQEEIDQQRRGARLSRGIAEIKAALGARDADAAAAALALLKREGFGSHDLAAVERDVTSLQQKLDKERRDQIDQQTRAARLARGLEDARAALARRDPDAASNTLDQLKREGLDSPDIAALQRDVKALRKQIDQDRKAAAAAAAAATAAAGGTAAAEPWRQAEVPSTTSSRLPLIGAAAAALIVIGGGLAYFLRPSSDVKDTTTVVTTAAPTTSVPPSGPSTVPALTTSAPVTVPQGASQAERLLAEALQLERGGNLREAARVLGLIPASAPEAGRRATSLQALVDNARRRATQARDRAEQANAVGNDDFLAGARAFTQGQRLAGQNPSQALDQFLNAEDGFNRARSSQVPTSTVRATTTIPLATTAPSTTTSAVTSVSTTTVPATTSVPPKPTGPDTSADRKAVEAVVRRYFTARSGLDLAAIQQVYPGLPADRERTALRSIQGACSEFSESPVEVNVLSVEGQEAVVRTRAQTTCKQKAGGQTTTTPPYRVFFELKKTASGAWQVAAVNRPDQTR